MAGLRIRICVILGSWIRIQIRTRVKSWIWIRIKSKFGSFYWLKIEPWRAMDAQIGGVEDQYGVLEGQYSSGRRFASVC
jgi:hypothetical protein